MMPITETALRALRVGKNDTPDEANLLTLQIRCSIVVSISACHAEDPGSIPGGGGFSYNQLPG